MPAWTDPGRAPRRLTDVLRTRVCAPSSSSESWSSPRSSHSRNRHPSLEACTRRRRCRIWRSSSRQLRGPPQPSRPPRPLRARSSCTPLPELKCRQTSRTFRGPPRARSDRFRIAPCRARPRLDWARACLCLRSCRGRPPKPRTFLWPLWGDGPGSMPPSPAPALLPTFRSRPVRPRSSK